MEFRVTYDREADAAYIYLVEIQAGESRRRIEAADGGVVLDLNSEGKLLGIEILGATSLLPQELLKRIQSRG